MKLSMCESAISNFKSPEGIKELKELEGWSDKLNSSELAKAERNLVELKKAQDNKYYATM